MLYSKVKTQDLQLNLLGHCGHKIQLLQSQDQVYSDYTSVTETSYAIAVFSKLIILGMGGDDAVVEADVVVAGVVVVGVEVDKTVVGRVVV